MMRKIGHGVVIGQLRPVGRRPTASSFEDLRECVVPAKLLSVTTWTGILLFIFRQRKLTWTYFKLVLGNCSDIPSLLKLTYILLVSMGLAYRLRHTGISHVHGHHLHSEAVSAMFISGFLGLQFSFKCYTVKTYYPRRVLTEVVQHAAFIIADTSQVRNFLDSLGADPNRVHLLRNAVALSECPMRAQDPASDPPVILAVGRLDYKKGFHVLLSACSILRDEGLPFRCVIVGDGDERNSLLARRRTLELEQQVEMVGRLGFSAVQHWYELATLLAVPSVVGPDGSTDGLPTVVIEAFARGVPVVGSSTAGIPEVIRNGTNGFVVAEGSASELATRMRELLSERGLRSKFATEGRRTAETEFDLERNARVLSELMLGRVAEQPGMISSVVGS